MDIEKLKQHECIDEIVKEQALTVSPITEEIIQDNKIILLEFVMEYKRCEKGPLRNCLQRIKGLQANLVYKNSKFYVNYSNCQHYIYENKNDLIKGNYIYKDFNVDEYPGTLKNYFENLKSEHFFTELEIKQRYTLAQNAGKIVLNYIDQKNRLDYLNIKGMYIYGKPGIGKTTMLRALANEAAKRKQKVFFATAPDIIEKCKAQFDKRTAESIPYIDQMKKADIFFIDDFAGEMVSTWSRDNLWFSVLNYRMNRNKLTFFSSNFSLKELNKLYLIKTNPKELDVKKVIRLKERIEALSSFYHLESQESKRK